MAALNSDIKVRRPQGTQGTHGLFEGRVLAISVLVGVALASFTLGYFVGGATAKRPPAQAELLIPSAPAPLAPANSLAPSAPEPQVEEAPRIVLPKPSTPKSEPTEPAQQAAATKPAQKDKADQKETKAQKAKKQAQQAEEITGGYIVQVGAFGSLSDAEGLRKKFTEKGYKASVYRDKSSEGKTIFKVKLGPYKDRETANQTATKAKSLSGTTPFVSANK